MTDLRHDGRARRAGIPFLLTALALAGCASSAGEARRLRDTQYTCDYSRLFGTVVEVVETVQPPLATANPERGLVVSEFRWHEPSGMRKKEGAIVVERGDLGFLVHVALIKQEAGYTIEAVPHVFEQQVGSPRGRELSHDDADWPGWADGKADRVLAAIHERLESCASAPAG